MSEFKSKRPKKQGDDKAGAGTEPYSDESPSDDSYCVFGAQF